VEGSERYFNTEILTMKKFGEKLNWQCIPGLICPLALSHDTIVTNYFSGVDMIKYIERKVQNNKYPDSSIICKIMYNTLEVMNILQNQLKMLHLDIKPENLRINEKLEVGIIDIGLACDFSIVGDCNIRGQGTPIYTPPEYYIQGLLTKDNYGKIDVWSLGCVLYQLLFLRHPMEYLYYEYANEKRNDSETMKMIYNNHYYEIERIIKKGMVRDINMMQYIMNIDFSTKNEEENNEVGSDEVLYYLKTLCLKMLRVSPTKRISIRRALEYITELYNWILENEDNISETSSDLDASEEESWNVNEIEMQERSNTIDRILDAMEESPNENEMQESPNTIDRILKEMQENSNQMNMDNYYKLSLPNYYLNKNEDRDMIVDDKKSDELLEWSDDESQDESQEELEEPEIQEESQDELEETEIQEPKKTKKKPLMELYNWLKKRRN
jgi:serine/threonine protein kinase